jgi:hypothetical protein
VWIARAQITVVASTWGAWKEAHPNTTIVARDGGIGREYAEDPLFGRDDDGPIFPIGDVDPRLPVQEQVVGVIAPDGTPVAFPAAAARAALEAGKQVKLAGVHLELDGDGLRAGFDSGEDAVSHQSFWFAWSQFHPGTAVWTHLAHFLDRPNRVLREPRRVLRGRLRRTASRRRASGDPQSMP